MKQLFSLIAFLAFLSFVSAQAPQGINFQGVARNTDNSPKPAGTSIQIEFKIWDAPNLGNLLYHEKQTQITNGVGLFTCIIGNGNVQPGSGLFSNIPWATGQKYLEVFVDNQSSARQLMVSVPYALYAASGNQGPQGLQGVPGVSSYVFDVSPGPGALNSDVRNNLISIGTQGNAETSVTAPATGNYLMLINLEVTFLRTTDDYARIYAVDANTSIPYIDQIIFKRDNTQNLTNDHIAAGNAWTIVQLNAGTQVNLKVQVTGQQSTQGFGLANGKIALLRLN